MVSGKNRPPTENAFTVTSRPSAYCSTIAEPPREAPSASAAARGTSSGPRTSPSPRCPCRSGALTTHGKPSRPAAPSTSSTLRQSSKAGCGTPTSRKRSRCRSFDVASVAVAAEIACGSPCRSATRAATATGQSMPGAITPWTRSASASRSMPTSSSAETIARRSA